jgi:glutamate synthase (NADPH) small chain
VVVYAIGTNPNPILGQTSRLKLNRRGYIEVDETLATSIAGVYAGGDIVTGAATVILAMGAGRKAARSIKSYLGIREMDSIYESPGIAFLDSLFGIPSGEKNFTRVTLSAAESPSSGS